MRIPSKRSLVLASVFAVLIVVSAIFTQPARAATPDFRIITVEHEYGQLIVEAQHFRQDGSHWFFEHYTFQGREAFKYPANRKDGDWTPHLDQGSILHTIQSIHQKRKLTGWTKGAQRLTTTPLDSTSWDGIGATMLAARFRPMEDRSFMAGQAGGLALFTGSVTAADMTVGPEAGTVSIFFPDPQNESATVDGDVWQNPDGESYEVSGAGDDAVHADATHTVSLAADLRCCKQSSQARESWWRYNNVVIPNAATITLARFEFTAQGTAPGSNSKIDGADEDDAPIIADDTGWEARVLTTASVDWDIPLNDPVALKRYQSPSVVAVVQEIVDRGGWASGNDMAFFWNNDADPAVSDNTRFVGFTNGGSAGSTLFRVEWTPAAPGTAWATIRGGAGNNYDDWSTTATTQIKAATTTDNWQNVGKGIFTFDTSALPDTDHISDADFEFVATSKADTLSAGQSVSMVTSAPATATALESGDFDSLGTTLQAPSLTISSITANSSTFNTFSLSATGRGSISKTGITKFGTRIATDVSDAEPAWSSGGTARVVMATADEDLSGDRRPKLTVTHSASGGSGGTTPNSGTRISPAIDLSGVTNLAYCAIGWTNTLPPGTTVTVSTSINGSEGAFTDAVNGSCPSGLNVGESLASITDFRTKVTLTTTDDTVTPLMTALGLIVEDESGQDVYYQLITTPSATLTDRSGSGNTGTMSYPVAPSGVTATTDPMVSLRTQLTFERSAAIPQAVSGVTGSATNDNLFGSGTGFTGLPGQTLVEAIANAGDGIPLRFAWFLFLGLFIIGSGAAVLMMTNSMLMSALAMAAIIGGIGAIGPDGLMPIWVVFVYVPMALILILVRPGKLAT